MLEYRTRGRPGGEYHAMSMSDDDLASFLLVGANESELKRRILTLHDWFDQNTRWADRAGQ